jgi:hypothetical protein
MDDSGQLFLSAAAFTKDLFVGKTTENLDVVGTVIGGGNNRANGTIFATSDTTPCILYNNAGAYALSVFQRFTGNTFAGGIFNNGSSVSYNTTSDYRLKENVVPLTGAIARLKQLSVYRFNFIADPTKTVDGFLAHEVTPVVAEAVTGEKDAVNEDGSINPQGIDQAKLTPLLSASLLEAIARIETLEAEVAALKAG